MPKVFVKWGREKYEVEVDSTKETPLTFKGQLFALSGVAPDRQKIMFKGKSLPDDTWTGFPELKDGAVLMLMGSSAALPPAPVQKTVFLEDMSHGELASALDIPAGLKNLGNTCYMNATLQCLKSIPELTEQLKNHHRGTLRTSKDAEAVVAAVADLYRSMDTDSRRNTNVIPFLMLHTIHSVFPRFAEIGEGGTFEQQDANECWVELVRMMQQRLRVDTGGGEAAVSAGGSSSGTSVVDRYMRGCWDVTMKCLEADEEPESRSTEDFLQLPCFLSQEVKYLHSGLRAKITEEIVKRSPTLKRDAKYEKKNLISRLPGYLTIQMIRFFYKEKDKINAKILKDVKFPIELDVFDLCTPELQERLLPIRDRFKIADDAALKRKSAKKAGDEKADDVVLKEIPWSFKEDPGSNNSGFYSLQAVLTHKGRSSNSGHYVGWVRKGEKWIMCDDEECRNVTEGDILKLSGGGDWHSAYILVYRSRILCEAENLVSPASTQRESLASLDAVNGFGDAPSQTTQSNPTP